MKKVPEGLKLDSLIIKETLMVLTQEKKGVVQFCKRTEILLLVTVAYKKIFFAFLGF